MLSQHVVVVALAGALVAAPHVKPTDYASLAAAFDNTAISDDANPGQADLDGNGNSLSAQDLAAAGWAPGAAITVDGTPFTWPDTPTGTPDNVVAAGQTVDVAGSGTALQFVATANNGPVTASGTLTYTDGTTQPYTVTVPDWVTGIDAPKAVGLPHWNTLAGQQNVSTKLYPESIPLAANKTVRSVTLPDVSAGVSPGTAALHVFAIGIRPHPGRWTGTWSASPETVWNVGPWTRQTLRMVVHDSIGGDRVRVRLANTFSGTPVVIGHATVAVQSSAGTATGTPATLTFGGRRQATIPAGGELLSDGVAERVPADANLFVSVYFPGPVTVALVHSFANTTSYTTAAGAGDHTADVAGSAFTGTFGFWTFLGDVDVMTSGRPTVVALGDSITDGVGSAQDANHRWPNFLAARVPGIGVLDEGISGNQIVTDQYSGGGVSAVDRLDRDVIDQPNARTVILFEGINDAKAGTSADRIIAGIQQIAARAHAFGLRILVATVAPFQGYSGYTDAYEATRETVNDYIRTSTDVDGHLDFDAVLRDPGDPLRLLPAYDCGDHLHPNDAGYQAVANSIDPRLLT